MSDETNIAVELPTELDKLEVVPLEEVRNLTIEEQQKRLDKVNTEKFGEPKFINLTIEMPNLVFEKIPDLKIRLGGLTQLEVEIREEYSFDDKPGDAVFTVIRQSPLDLKISRMLRCLDDLSIPTVDEWKEQIGHKVLWRFVARPLPMEEPHLSEHFQRVVYHKHWTYLTIPERV